MFHAKSTAALLTKLVKQNITDLHVFITIIAGNVLLNIDGKAPHTIISFDTNEQAIKWLNDGRKTSRVINKTFNIVYEFNSYTLDVLPEVPEAAPAFIEAIEVQETYTIVRTAPEEAPEEPAIIIEATEPTTYDLFNDKVVGAIADHYGVSSTAIQDSLIKLHRKHKNNPRFMNYMRTSNTIKFLEQSNITVYVDRLMDSYLNWSVTTLH